jgi:hypothetical protein
MLNFATGFNNSGIVFGNLQDALEPIISSYFYLTSPEPRARIDFIHSSFKEYLLAEYYIESLLLDKPYRLNVGMPSSETMTFLNRLLEFLFNDDDSEQPSAINHERNRFLKSFVHLPDDEEITISILNRP